MRVRLSCRVPTQETVMSETEYEVGQVLWFAEGRPGLTKGTVVHKFQIDNMQMYVLSIPTEIDDLYVVRDWMTLSEDGKALNMWKRVADATNTIWASVDSSAKYWD